VGTAARYVITASLFSQKLAFAEKQICTKACDGLGAAHAIIGKEFPSHKPFGKNLILQSSRTSDFCKAASELIQQAINAKAKRTTNSSISRNVAVIRILFVVGGPSNVMNGMTTATANRRKVRDRISAVQRVQWLYRL